MVQLNEPTFMTEELTHYKEFIKGLAVTKYEETFLNSGIEHAEIILSTLFSCASQKLRIFAQSLTSPLAQSDSYIDALSNFLNINESQLFILLQENQLQKNPKLLNQLSYIQYIFPDKIQIKKSYCALKSTQTGKNIHFTVGDDDLFRFEHDTENYRAFGSFNNKDFSSTLIQKFDDVFNSDKSEVIIF